MIDIPVVSERTAEVTRRVRVDAPEVRLLGRHPQRRPRGATRRSSRGRHQPVRDARSSRSSAAEAVAARRRRRARSSTPSSDRVRAAAPPQRCAGVEQHAVGDRPRLALERRTQTSRRSRRRPAAQRVERRRRRDRHPTAFERRCARPSALDHDDDAFAGTRELVRAAGAVDDDRAFDAETRERAGDEVGELGRADADELERRPGRVRQGAEDVERGPDRRARGAPASPSPSRGATPART